MRELIEVKQKHRIQNSSVFLKLLFSVLCVVLLNLVKLRINFFLKEEGNPNTEKQSKIYNVKRSATVWAAEICKN